MNRKTHGIYETVPAKAAKKVVLFEDNADLRKLFPPRSVKSKCLQSHCGLDAA